MKLTVLGSGTSHGVPMIACECEVCRSSDPRDKRLRSSVLVEIGDAVILIDTAPDLRQQMLTHAVRRVDAVLITHTHADHLNGLDDLRAFSARQGASIPIFGNDRAIDDIRTRFRYIFEPTWRGGGLPMLDLHAVDGPFTVQGQTVTPIPIVHGTLPVFGYRIGGSAYVTDCNSIPDTSLSLLRDLDVLIIDALRFHPHPTHFTIPEALALVAALAPRRAYLTHLTHDVSHVRDSAALPPGVELAYDGLVIVSPGAEDQCRSPM